MGVASPEVMLPGRNQLWERGRQTSRAWLGTLVEECVKGSGQGKWQCHLGCEQQVAEAAAELMVTGAGERQGCGPFSGVDRGQGAKFRQQLRVGVQAGQAALLQGDGLS